MIASTQFASLFLALAGVGTPTAADHNIAPGSLMVFPEFDNRQGSVTFLTVTNTSSTDSVRVHLVYVDRDDCSEQDASELLTPRDTITTTSVAHAPTPAQGYAYAYARSSVNGMPVTFNHLVGSEMVIDGISPLIYNVSPIVFRGLTDQGTTTDLDFDGVRDLNGVEYGEVPDEIVIPRFFGQQDHLGVGPPFRSELIMIGLTGRQFTTTLAFTIFNDNEQGFSAQHTFFCWDRVRLIDISGAFVDEWLRRNTNHDEGEIVGMSNVESGWILIDGSVATSSVTSVSDPAFLAILVETGRVGSASLPFGIGSQDNGDLLPSSLFGDF